MRKTGTVAAALVVVLALYAPVAVAVTLDFHSITRNDSQNVETGVAQFRVDVVDEGSGRVSFTFTNEGPESSVITGVYFDDGSLLANMSIDTPREPRVVSFSEVSPPSSLSGGTDIGFVSGFLAEADSPKPHEGVNNNTGAPGTGESLTVTFDLIGVSDRTNEANTFEDVIYALTWSPEDLRIGLTAQGFDFNEGSESFVNNPIPEPSTALGLATFSVMGLAIRRRNQRIARRPRSAPA
jgi:hypothetical protein